MLTWVAKKLFGTSHERAVRRMQPIVDAINALEPKMQKLSDAELQAKTAEFKEKLDNGATLDDILVEAFAALREAGKRVLKMRHYDVQLIGGMVLHKGAIAEMRTGEGKTLVATLPVYLNALEGKGVHVVTVNDYLAKRDAEWMGKLYELARPVASAPSSTSRATREKRAAYRCDITLRPEQRVRLRLPARQHEVLGARLRAAPAQLRDRRRGRLDPDRRGAHAAHHQRPGRGRRARSTRRINEIIPRLRKDEHYVVDEKGTQRHAHRRRRRDRAEADRRSRTCTTRSTSRRCTSSTSAARAHALQARRQHYMVTRRQGPDHRRVHRPRARRPPLVRRPAPGRRGQGERAHPGREPHDGDHHVPEPLPHLQEARAA